MKKEKIFIIGGGALQVEFIETVKKNNYETHVFDYNPECKGAFLADKFYCISIDEQEKIYEIALKEKPVAIHTVATELGNITACYVGEKLGLSTNSYDTALNTVDKVRMKKVFVENNIPTAQTKTIYHGDEIADISLLYPVVVKASDRSAGRGIAIANNQQELFVNYQDAYEYSQNKVVLIEEYLQGKQYSIELVSQNGCHHILGVTREYFIDEINFVESHYLMPAYEEEVIIKENEELFFKTLDAFNIQYGASHIEFRIVNGQVMIIEIASRMGGMRDKFLELSKGIYYNQLILNSITQQPINIQSKLNNYVLSKSMFNSHDECIYNELLNTQSMNIIINAKKEVEYTDVQPKTLMDAKDIYYLICNEKEQCNEVLEIWKQL